MKIDLKDEKVKKKFLELFPTTSYRKLAEIFEVSEDTIYRVRNKLGLKKKLGRPEIDLSFKGE